MPKLAHIAAGLMFAALAASPAAAQNWSEAERNCRDDRGVDRCSQEQQRRTRALFSVRSIEEHRDAGDQVRRVFYVDGYGRDVVTIAFVRTPGQDPAVWVHHPHREGEGRPEPLRASVPLRIWEEVIERGRHFDRRFVASPPPPAESGIILMCLHSWVYTIEAADGVAEPQQAIRRKTEDACEDGPGEVYAQELRRIALSLIPHCAALDPSQHRNPASQLSACRLLSGDRMAAAEAFNRLDAFRRARGPDDLHELDAIFAQNAVVDWSGARSPPGQAQSFWAAKIGEAGANVFYRSLEGLSATRVRFSGSLERSFEPEGEGSTRYEHAPVEMIWVLGPTREFEVESVTVGPWQPR